MNNAGINQYSYKRRRSVGVIIWSWLGALLSVLLLLPVGGMVVADVTSYRPCSINTTGLSISECGRRSVGIADLVLLALFVGSVLLAVSAVTYAFRITRKG